MARPAQPDKPPKVFDVAKPGSTPAAASSRPVIIGHGPMAKDPMMSEPKTAPTVEVNTSEQPDETEKITNREVVITPSDEAIAAAKKTSDEAKAAPDVAEGEKLTNTKAEVKDDSESVPVTVTVTSAAKSEPAEEANATTDTPAEETSAEEKPADEPAKAEPESSDEVGAGAGVIKPADSMTPEGASDASKPIEDSDAMSAAKAAAKKEEDAVDADRAAKAKELISKKTYNVRMSKAAHRHKSHGLWMVLILILLILVGAYAAVDAGMVKVNGLTLPYDFIKDQ